MDYQDEEIDVDKLEDTREAFDIEMENDRSVSKAGTLLGRRPDDLAYRHRLSHTLCVCFSLFALGWRNALIGPTFPDLRLIIDENLTTSSWIFTAKSLGGLLGSVLGGFAYDRFNKIGVSVFLVLGMGIIASITPWCYHFAAMLVVHVFHGMFAVAVDTAGTADMAVIWRQDAGPFMQAIHFAFSVGAIISPLTAESFLAKTIVTEGQIALEQSNSSILTSTGMQIVTPTLDLEDNRTKAEMSINMTSVKYGTSRIYVPYSISSLVCFVSAFLYLPVCLFYGNVYRVSLHGFSERKTDTSQKRYFLSKKMKILFTVLLALTLLFYVVSEHSFIGFLMTFIISELKWSKARGSTASSAFWIAFAIGRLSGIIIVKFVNISTMLIIFFTILTSGAVLFLLAVLYSQNVLVWASVIVIGYGMSVIFGLVFSWLSQNIRTLTGKMTSIFFVFMCIGNMVIPILLGYLMENISQLCFIYSLLIWSFAMFAIVTFAFVYFNLLKKSHGNSDKSKAIYYKPNT